jgi:hypothetical protein
MQKKRCCHKTTNIQYIAIARLKVVQGRQTFRLGHFAVQWDGPKTQVAQNQGHFLRGFACGGEHHGRVAGQFLAASARARPRARAHEHEHTSTCTGTNNHNNKSTNFEAAADKDHRKKRKNREREREKGGGTIILKSKL